MLITVTTAVTFPVFAVLIAISSALRVSLRAVSATLIRWGLVDKLIVPKGLSNLRGLSTLNPVSPYPVSYLLSELSHWDCASPDRRFLSCSYILVIALS